MKKVVIGCSVLQKEMEAFFKTESSFKFVWLEDHLHNSPERLHEKVQGAIDAEGDADQIYLLYGHCGQALTGVVATHCPLILPKVEDCIDVLLYKNEAVEEMRRSSYFISQGWLWGEDGLGYDYDKMKEKRGEKRALRAIKAMYRNYTTIQFVKTGIETEADKKKCARVAEILELDLAETKGDIEILLEMLKGAKDQRFIMIPKGEVIREEMFRKVKVED